MDERYKNGKIYKLIADNDIDNKSIYIGSTIHTLKKDYVLINHMQKYILKLKCMNILIK